MQVRFLLGAPIYDIILIGGSLAQLVEHLTLNQGVTGSSPVRPTIYFARVAELVDALDLGSSGRIAHAGSTPALRTRLRRKFLYGEKKV